MDNIQTIIAIIVPVVGAVALIWKHMNDGKKTSGDLQSMVLDASKDMLETYQEEVKKLRMELEESEAKFIKKNEALRKRIKDLEEEITKLKKKK